MMSSTNSAGKRIHTTGCGDSTRRRRNTQKQQQQLKTKQNKTRLHNKVPIIGTKT